MYETYPQYVEAEPEPNNRLRANSWNDLQQKRIDHGREGNVTFRYYVVDPTHSAGESGSEHNICNPDDPDDRRVFTLAFLAPHLLPVGGHKGSLHSLTNVKNTAERIQGDETVWYEYVRAQSCIIPDDNRWSPTRNDIALDRSDQMLIRATRFARTQYERKEFSDQDLNDADEFSVAHIKQAVATYFGERANSTITPDDVTKTKIESLVGKKTAPPKMPYREGIRAVFSYIIEHDREWPENQSTEEWAASRGIPEATWTNARLGYDGKQYYDYYRLQTLCYGDELREAYEDAIGETFPRYQCGGCNLTFPTRDRVATHQRRDCELDPDERICEFCDKTFTGENAGVSLGAHRKQHDLDTDAARRHPPNRHKYDGDDGGPVPGSESQKATTVETEAPMASYSGPPLDMKEQYITERPTQPSTDTEPEPGSLELVYADGAGVDVEYEDAELLLPDDLDEPDEPDEPALTDPSEHDITDIIGDFDLPVHVADGNADTILDALGVDLADLVNAKLAQATPEERDDVLFALIRGDASDDHIIEFRNAERAYEGDQ